MATLTPSSHRLILFTGERSHKNIDGVHNFYILVHLLREISSLEYFLVKHNFRKVLSFQPVRGQHGLRDTCGLLRYTM